MGIYVDADREIVRVRKLKHVPRMSYCNALRLWIVRAIPRLNNNTSYVLETVHESAS